MAGYEYLIKFFREEGFRYSVEENIIRFTIQRVTFIAFKNEESSLLQIIVICNSEGYPREKQLEVCNTLNQDYYVIKFSINSDSTRVWCSYEFEPDELTDGDKFMGIFAALDKASDKYFELLTTDGGSDCRPTDAGNGFITLPKN